MGNDPVDMCEIKIGGRWQALGLGEALRLRLAGMRCSACLGRVRAHKAGTTGQRAHFGHREAHAGCPLKAGTFSGHRSLHPGALD